MAPRPKYGEPSEVVRVPKSAKPYLEKIFELAYQEQEPTAYLEAIVKLLEHLKGKEPTIYLNLVIALVEDFSETKILQKLLEVSRRHRLILSLIAAMLDLILALPEDTDLSGKNEG